ncbi:MAG: DUF4097 domain-containing protein, partial [Leptolyngbya sp. SIO1D8]|nr:DUF4097 domain-containing protein [Leptolyngbya sp. SIO1D8]
GNPAGNPLFDPTTGELEYGISSTPSSADITINEITVGPEEGHVFLTNLYAPNLALSGGDITVTGTNLNPFAIGNSSVVGNGGSIVIDARRSITIGGGGQTARVTTSSDNGVAGDVTFLAQGNINFLPGFSIEAIGFSGGNVELVSNLGGVAIADTEIIAVGVGGNGGDINISAGQIIDITNSDFVTSSDVTDAGNISFVSDSGDINLEIGALLASGEGGGDITLDSNSGDIFLNDSFVASYVAGLDRAGSVSLDASNIFLSNASVVINATAGNVAGGPITINADQVVDITDSGTTRTISLANLQGSGLPPGLVPNLPPGTIPSGTGITANTIFEAEGGGHIVVNANQLRIQNLSPIGSENRAGITTASTINSTGDAGNIEVFADVVKLIGNDPTPFNPQQEGSGLRNQLGQIIDIPTGITSSTNGTGNSGVVKVNTDQLIIQNTAAITSGNTFNSQAGNGDDIIINAAESIELEGLAVIASGTVGSGQAGDVLIDVPNLTLSNGAIIAADTFGSGDAGGVEVNADQVEVLSGARIGASTDGSGNAGSLIIPNASRILVDGVSEDGSVPSRIFFSSTGNTDSTGNAGELQINTQELIVQNGGEIAGDTEGSGSGGLLSLASSNIQVRGPGSEISFESRGSGNARGIEIETGQLVVENQGIISVSGQGDGTSGDLNVTADAIFLNQQGRLTSETQASQGGNIRLRVTDSITMRNDGNPTEATEISARAFGDANGGNIFFDVDGVIFAVLTENSDVLAAAALGQGGTITGEVRQGIFGFREFQGVVTPESDFTATATTPLGTAGIVDVDTLEPPEQESLPDDFAGNDIAQGCIAAAVPTHSSNFQSSFRIIGRGGLPNQPVNAQSVAALEVGLVDPVEASKVPAKDDLGIEPHLIIEDVSLPPAISCISQ